MNPMTESSNMKMYTTAAKLMVTLDWITRFVNLSFLTVSNIIKIKLHYVIKDVI